MPRETDKEKRCVRSSRGECGLQATDRAGAPKNTGKVWLRPWRYAPTGRVLRHGGRTGRGRAAVVQRKLSAHTGCALHRDDTLKISRGLTGRARTRTTPRLTMIDTPLEPTALREALASIADEADYLDVTVHLNDHGVVRASMAEAVAALASGEAIAVRLRYRVRDHAWLDLLTGTSSGFRLLRVPRSFGGYTSGAE